MQDIIIFINHHMTLSLIFVVVFFMLVVIEFMRLKRSTSHLSPAQLTSLMNHHNALVVDIRSADSFANGHIVGAISLPLSEIEAKIKKLEKHKAQPIVIVCDTGNDAPRAATILNKQGFTTQLLAGGIRAWRTADMPIVKG
jgi:rhodanese-related sulfurtransferase